MPICPKCEVTFQPARKSQKQCRDCFNAYHREWERKNKDKVRVYSKNKHEKLMSSDKALAEFNARRREYRKRVHEDPIRQEADARKGRFQKLKVYGIDEVDYNKLLEEQNGVCAICRLPESAAQKGKLLRLAVDHDHKTGRIRGLLCHRCNRGLGLAKDSIELFRNAADYLRKYK
jgi:hypothetical protein